jgi:hypothetical protein
MAARPRLQRMAFSDPLSDPFYRDFRGIRRDALD